VPIVYISIGSNLGDREENCLKAIQLLSAAGISITKQSTMFETEPWGLKEQPRFINMAVEAGTGEGPYRLLEILKEIERNMGRGKTTKWGPRIIDLDILFYDGLVIDTPELKIPHPLMHEREFVLGPLAEIAPDKVHPVLKKTVRELLRDKPQRHRDTEN
jgi:dihydroneopterin aldolase/2-amino-4-hydroxy-6-hydroxymethyldihydropteridine diphosphokinase